jgi:hypothetical protein
MTNYNWLITLKKFGIIAAEVVIAGLISYATEDPRWMALVPFLEAIRNIVKHWAIPAIKGE